ncbi:DNRLRE domain-containing protein [Gottfriedia sp. NPDC057991]|uniref:DNRLRE domain-containing protein n=1 Tax=Gottfriedia sp. NPDC057991 TaxID=3346298 RepID=UPI0036DDB489
MRLRQLSNDLKRLLSASLISTLIISSIPFNQIIGHASTSELTEAEKAQQMNSEFQKQIATKIAIPPSNEAKGTKELTDKRTEFTKSFSLGNGNYSKQVYSEPIFNESDSNKLQPVSTRLVDSTTSDEDAKPVNTDLDVTFKDSVEKGLYSTFLIDNHQIDYSLLGAEGEANTLEPHEGIKPNVVENRITYENIIDDVDIRNIVFNKSVKEDIILSKYNGVNKFNFFIKTDLNAKIDDNKKVIFSDENNNELFYIPAPHMSDSNLNEESGEPATSYGVSYELKKVDDGYNLSLVADDKWLKDDSRKYPVYIDPTVYKQSNYTFTDSFTSDAYKTTNYDNFWDSTYGFYALKSGYYDASSGTNYSFIKPSISGLSGANISSATFDIYTGHSASSSATTVWLDKVTSADWSASTITWNNQPSSTNIATDSVAKGDTASFNVTNTVKGWVNGSIPNYGFKVHENGQGSTYWKKFYSEENSTNQPKLTINYSYPTPSQPTIKTYSHNDGTDTNYMDLSWTAVPGAKGYKVWFYNGATYQSIDVKNVTSWSTNGQKIWPTPSEISNGIVNLHTDKTGAELPRDPSATYTAAKSVTNADTLNYFVSISAYFDGGESDCSTNLTPILPIEKPTGIVDTTPTDPDSGYVKFNWRQDPKAKGYFIWAFNGKGYEGIDVGNALSWSSQNMKIWPTEQEIASGRYLLHLNDNKGVELPRDPSPVYRNAGSTMYANSPYFWFRVTAYYDDDHSIMSDISDVFKVSMPSQATNLQLGTKEYWSMGEIPGGQVNLSNGNFVISNTDYSLQTRSESLGTTRTYNSQSNKEGIFGYGWTSSYEQAITVDTNGDLILTDDVGTQLRYSKIKVAGKDLYQAPVGEFDDLELQNNGTYTLKDPSGSLRTFNTTGKLIEINDSEKHIDITLDQTGGHLNSVSLNGTKKIQYAYNSNGKVDTITYLTGSSSIIWTYSYTNNLLNSVKDSLGNVTKYNYTNNLISEIREPNDTAAKPYVTKYTYVNGKISNVTNAFNKVINISYDPSNLKASISDYKGVPTDYYYDSYTSPSKVTIDPNGVNITTKSVYQQNKLVETTDPNSVDTNTSYDDNGNVTRETNEVNTSTNEESCYQYDEDNNLTKLTDTFKDASDSSICPDLNNSTIYQKKNQKVFRYTQEDDQNVSSVNPDTSSSANVYDTATGNLISASSEISVSNNLLSNPGMEHTTLDGWGFANNNSTGTHTLDTNQFHSGKQSERIDISSANATFGYHALTQSIIVKPDTTYTFSAYIKSNDIKNSRAFLNIGETNTEDSTVLWYNNKYYPVKGTADWSRREISFTTGPNAKNVVLYLEMDHTSDSASGTAWFDDVQFEENETLSAYNPVENSNFEKGASSWTATNATDALFDTDVYFEGLQSLKITKKTGNLTTTSYSQTIPVYQTKAKPLTISGMSKSNITNEGTGSTVYGLYYDVTYTDNTISNGIVSFAKGTHDWQRNASTLNDNPSTAKPIKIITLKAQLGGKVGSVWFDNLRIQDGSVWTKNDYDSSKTFVTGTTNPLGIKTSSTYDANGNVLSSTDGEGYTNNFKYNDNNQLTSSSLPSGTKAVYQYNNNGNVIEKKLTNEDGTTVYNKTTYVYNELNQLVSVLDPLNNETKSTYDENGNLDTVTAPNGDKITNSYDSTNKQTELKVNDVSWYKYGLDKNGNKTSIQDVQASQTKSFTYDLANRMTSQSVNGIKTSWTYDNDQLSNRKIDDGKNNENNGVSYTYDSGGRNTLITDNELKEFHLSYNDSGTLHTFVSANSVGASMEYDDLDRMTQLVIADNNGTKIAGYKYDYDQRNNIKTITNDNGNITSFQYDQDNQLTDETIPTTGQAVHYDYDKVGNRIKKSVSGSTNQTINYEYNAANQLTKVDGQYYMYDKNGNLTNDGQFIYVWDALGNLITVKKASDSSDVANYKYDDQNRRIYKNLDGKITKFVYDRNSIQPIYETDESGNITFKYIYNANGQLIARYNVTDPNNPKKYYYQLNKHGDVIAVTDNNGSVVASYEYDAWGNVVQKSGAYADENPIRYAGYYFDNETGLYYLIARYYNSLNGNFLSIDPISGDIDDVLGQHEYIYVSNNPVTYVDPNGNVRKLPEEEEYGGEIPLEGPVNFKNTSEETSSNEGIAKPLKFSKSVYKNMRTLRKWAKSKGWIRKYTDGGVEMWGVKKHGEFKWRLKLKPEASNRPGLQEGSNKPRFDARLKEGVYVNPFTGHVGGKSVGTHLPL